MFKKLSVCTLICVILLTACNQYQKAASGMLYKITKGKSKIKVQNNDYIKLHIKYVRKRKDSVLNSTFGKIPVYVPIDTSKLGKFNFLEIVTKCSKGDKIKFILNIDTLVKLGFLQYSPVFTLKDEVIGYVEILDIFKNVTQVETDNKLEIEKFKKQELTDLKDYTKKKKYNVVESDDVFVQIDNVGDNKNMIDSGKYVSILYEGHLLNDTIFDRNNDKNNPNNKPLSFTIQQTPMIPGFVNGLKKFGKGGKGIIFIPSLLAYGQQGSPPVIPPYSSIYFKIEIVDVLDKDPNPPAPNPEKFNGDVRKRR